MADRVLIGEMGGETCIRVSLPGFDVLDPALTNEQLAFDSRWKSVFSPVWTLDRVAIDYRNVGASPSPGFSYWKPFYTFPAPLSYVPIVIAWEWNGTRHGAIDAECFMDRVEFNDLVVSAGKPAGRTFSMFIFNTPAEEGLPVEDGYELDRICIGTHPLYGSGAFISRRGVNVLSASLDDLVFSTNKPNLQIDASGVAAGQLTVPSTNTRGLLFDITIPAARPDRPPVFCQLRTYEIGGGGSGVGKFRSVSHGIQWLSDTRFQVTWGTWNADAGPLLPWQMYWWLPSASIYQTPGPGNDTDRILIDGNLEMKVSKRNVDVLTASANDLLFDSTKSMLHINDRKIIGAGDTEITIPNSGSGVPLVVFSGKINTFSGLITKVGQLSDNFNNIGPVTRIVWTSGQTTISHRQVPANKMPAVRYNLISFSKYQE